MTIDPARLEQIAFEAAIAARNNAYAPYSRFRVGSAVSSGNGDVTAGCNVENRVHGATLCAERNALSAAIAKGNSNFTLVVITSDSPHPIAPCGACRQAIAELAPMAVVVSLSPDGKRKEWASQELLPG